MTRLMHETSALRRLYSVSIVEMSNRELARHTNTFRVSHPQRIKRNRPTVSCSTCRARKQKCDRQQPCSGCQRRGLGGSCRFESISTPAKSTSAENSEMGVRTELGRMRGVLQRLLSHPAQVQSEESVKQLLDSIDCIEKTVNKDTRRQVAPAPPASQLPDIIFGTVAKVSLQDILTTVPPRKVADRIVSTYFNAKHAVVPFIHTHQFRKQYEEFWKDPVSSSHLWVSIMFSIVAIGASISGASTPFSGPESSLAYTNMSARCLVSGQYQKAVEFSVEALTLHLHSRRFHQKSPDVDLCQLHALAVRLAHQRFYHCEMNQFLQLITPFEAEMRRRVWYFIQYYDVLFSLEYGVPPLIHEYTHSTDHPTDAQDDDFDEDSTVVLPRATTDTSLPCVLMSQVLPILRRIICHALGFSTCSYSDAMLVKAQLDIWYQSIPSSLRIRSIKITAFTDSNHIIMQRVLFELIYTTFITLLYRPYLDSLTYSDYEFQTALDVCRKNAVRSVRISIEVDREMQEGGRLHDDRHVASSLSINDLLMSTTLGPLEFFECVDLPPIEGNYIVNTLQTAVQLWSTRPCFSPHVLENSRLLRITLASICVVGPELIHISHPVQDSNYIVNTEDIGENRHNVSCHNEKEILYEDDGFNH
ncbi:hypothetical protein SNK04_006569 [Fusarium graminearum]